ncbi:MAG: hypothetical protein ACRDQ7_08275 [Haloechinothrix sp.]
MSPKCNERVAPPPSGSEWDVRYSTTEAVKGWEELGNAAPGRTNEAWATMRTNPGPGPGKPTTRHHQLRGDLSTGTHAGRELPMWQIEVTSGARVWYLLDEGKHIVWLKHAGVGHPKSTD